jgi:hypothetical protein
MRRLALVLLLTIPGTMIAQNFSLVTRDPGQEHHRDGFVTCIAMRLNPDGECTLANAGHLAPYRNGKEIQLENGLPLGIAPEASYSETTIQLAPPTTAPRSSPTG